MASRLSVWTKRGSHLASALLSGMLFLSVPAVVLAAQEVELTGFTILQETDSGRWEIESDVALYDGKGNVLLDGVSATMTGTGGKLVWVSGRKGRFESDNLLLFLEGEVTVTSDLGSVFRAPRVRWDGSQSVVEADGGVLLQRGPLTVTGSKIRYKVGTGTAYLDGGVRSVWREGSFGP